MSIAKVKLGTICTIEKGCTGIQKAIPGEFPLVVTGEDRKSHNEYQFDTEAVIVPLVSGTGHGHASIKRIHYQTGKFALGNILCAIIPKDKKQLDAEYLYRFLDLNKERELVSRMKGMANVTLPIKEIAQIEIPLPSIEVQREFVVRYSLLEADSSKLAAEFNYQLDLVKKLRQQLLQDAVQGKLAPQDSNDEPASVLLQRIKAEKAKDKKYKELPPIKPEEIPFEIPENWVWCRLGEVCNIYTGPFGSMLHSSDYVEGQIPIVNPTNIVNERIVPIWGMTVANTTAKGLNSYILHTGDIIIGRRGEMGRCAEVTEKEDGWLCGTGSFFIQLDFSLLSSYFVKVIGSNFSRQYFLGSSVGSTMNNLNHKILGNLLVPLPPLFEQPRIVAILEQLNRTCDELESSIKASIQQNEQLLQQVLREALSGNGAVEQPEATAANLVQLPAESKLEKDIALAIIVARMKDKLGVSYGEVAMQKTVFHVLTFENTSVAFLPAYDFKASNFGTYCYTLRDDLKANPYLKKEGPKGKEFFVADAKKNSALKKAMADHKDYVAAVDRVLRLYALPLINKKTDQIELLNTVAKVIIDLNTADIDAVYQGMKDWHIEQDKYTTKAEKFSKKETVKMLQFIVDNGLLELLLGRNASLFV